MHALYHVFLCTVLLPVLGMLILCGLLSRQLLAMSALAICLCSLFLSCLLLLLLLLLLLVVVVIVVVVVVVVVVVTLAAVHFGSLKNH